jgi:hypothetical protein
LKLKIAAIPAYTRRPESVKNRSIKSFSAVADIITGARGTIGKTLEVLGRSDLKDRIMASMIPF